MKIFNLDKLSADNPWHCMAAGIILAVKICIVFLCVAAVVLEIGFLFTAVPLASDIVMVVLGIISVLFVFYLCGLLLLMYNNDE